MIEKLLIHAIWSAIAAWGFGVLFNLPKRALPYASLLAIFGHTIREIFIQLHWGGIIVGSFFGALTVGLVGAFFAKRIKIPAIMYCVCSVIPMVPGYFSYLFFFYLIKMVITQHQEFVELYMINSFSNGVKALLIFIGLSVGVTIPLLWHKKIMDEKDFRFLE